MQKETISSRPREFGLDFTEGNKLMFIERVDLAASTNYAIENLIRRHWQEMQYSDYQHIVYKTVANWVRKKFKKN